jgi:hypothetical protein
MPDDVAFEAGLGAPSGYTVYGVSEDVWAGLSAEERKQLIARYEAEQAAARSPERASQIEALHAASRARAASESAR